MMQPSLVPPPSPLGMGIHCDRTPPWFPTTCNISGIRIFFVVSFVLIWSEFRQTFRRVLCGKTFCHKILPSHFCSSEFRQNLNWSNEIFDEISTIFLWQNVVAKCFATRPKKLSPLTFWRKLSLWQNVLPQHFATKKIVEISSKTSLKFRQTWVEATKSLTKFQRNFHVHFLWQKVWQNGLPQELPQIFNKIFNEFSTIGWRYTRPIANHEQYHHKVYLGVLWKLWQL